MRHYNCKFGDKCKYFHPRRLKKTSQNKEIKTEKPIIHEDRPTYANIVRKSMQSEIPKLQSNDPFLGLAPPVQQNFTGQVHQVQQPFLGQANYTQQTFLDIQNQQKQMMEMFLSLNQKMNNMYSMKM